MRLVQAQMGCKLGDLKPGDFFSFRTDLQSRALYAGDDLHTTTPDYQLSEKNPTVQLNVVANGTRIDFGIDNDLLSYKVVPFDKVAD